MAPLVSLLSGVLGRRRATGTLPSGRSSSRDLVGPDPVGLGSRSGPACTLGDSGNLGRCAPWLICLDIILCVVSFAAMHGVGSMTDIHRIGLDEVARHFEEL